jgi:hypothetical protein
MFALLVLVENSEKENPDVRAESRRGLGLVDLFRTVKSLPFFIEIRMDIGCADPLQDFFEAIINLLQSQSYWVTNRRGTG